jgi:hypothetical protein
MHHRSINGGMLLKWTAATATCHKKIGDGRCGGAASVRRRKANHMCMRFAARLRDSTNSAGRKKDVAELVFL